MSGFGYTTAIAATFGIAFGIVGGLKVAPSAAAWASRTVLPQAFDRSVFDPAIFDDWGKWPSSLQRQSAEPTDPELEPNTPVNALSSPAARDYNRAMELADQAVSAYLTARESDEGDRSLAFIRREQFLWRASLQKLAAIPQGSNLYKQAAIKREQYQRLLATADGKLFQAESAFLTDILSGIQVNPDLVHITLCQIDPVETRLSAQTVSQSASQQDSQAQSGQIDGDLCRHHRGDQPMASPASLIKVPVAVALMHKVTAEKIDLDSEIYIDPGNFTEDAQGAVIEVGNEYPLRKVMSSMINQSNNTATNQLIDYVGRDYIAKALNDLGYTDTYAGHKLIGDRVMPQNPGSRGNRLTTNTMTAMMVQIYQLETPGDEELVSALVSQHDQELGYEALKDLGPAVHWIGEKTGQNNRVLGSTLAVKIGEERYALTVALDHSGDVVAMQQSIRAIAAHLLETGPLSGRVER
ncbi:serine hydrolase [Leptolyngbya sp. BC1307]|uniref:serine hydrolase n=1 Tax=Leptolyngbya sp. BC1307 TaxID=2029589 RepID=UPI000EFB94CD|nr:serine hydrolase [Leptolyngbya sp. BC1307]